MKALSLLQPWASLVAIGAKRIETRSWHMAYRGPLLIHASKRYTRSMKDAACQGQIGYMLAFTCYEKYSGDPYGLPTASILCLVDLVDCVKITADNAPPEPERFFGNYEPGRYAWHMANVRRLERPVPAQGRLGLWTPTEETLAAVMEQLKGAA